MQTDNKISCGDAFEHKIFSEGNSTNKNSQKRSSSFVMAILSPDRRRSSTIKFVTATKESRDSAMDLFKEILCCDSTSENSDEDKEYFEKIEMCLEGENIGKYIIHPRQGGDMVLSIVLREDPTNVKHYGIQNKAKLNLSSFQIKVAAQLIVNAYREEDAVAMALLMLKKNNELCKKYSENVYLKIALGEKKVLFKEERDGDIYLENIERIDEGALGKVYRVGGDVLKQAKIKSLNKSHDVKKQAFTSIVNEYAMLLDIHKKAGSNGTLIGIQDAPKKFITIKSFGKSKIIKERTGILGSAYINSLRHKIGKCSAQTIQNYMFQIFTGLQTLEDLKIHHGDLKPDNLFYKGDTVCIADFGGAKKIFKETLNTSVKILTKHYICPEDTVKIKNIENDLLLGEEEKVHKIGIILLKSDIYAASVTFLELVLGMKLIDAVKFLYETSEHFSFNLLDPMLKKELNAKGFSEAVIKLLLRGVASNYEDRPSASEFIKVTCDKSESITDEKAVV